MHGGIWLGAAMAALLTLVGAPATQAATGHDKIRTLLPQAIGQWPSYMQNSAHSGYNGAETQITPVTATSLARQWSFATNLPVSAQPIEANGVVYMGSWDGYERALTTQGTVVWSTFLGQTSDSICDPPLAGIVSTPFVTQATPGNLLSTRSMLYVGGGDGQVYALDALTGAIKWSTRLGPSPSTFMWSSPLVYAGSVYIGVSSFGDCPLVQGQMVKLNATTGAIQQIFNVVPNGCTGGGVWGSPTLDVSTGIIYFATGNAGGCSTNESYAVSLIAVHASDLSFISFWQIPPSQQIVDGDFGSSSTLFTATINGVAQPLLGIVDKNGVYYAFKRTNIGAGPIWSRRLDPGSECPQCGTSAIAPAAWDGQTLFVAGGITTINNKSCQGSVQALDPATGAPRWQACLAGAILGAVSAVPGVVFVGAGTAFYALAASSGATLFTFTDPAGQPFFGPASIASGSVYIGNMDGALYCFRTGTARLPPVRAGATPVSP